MRVRCRPQGRTASNRGLYIKIDEPDFALGEFGRQIILAKGPDFVPF